MQALFAPAISIMNRLSFPKKYGLMGGIVFIAVLSISAALYTSLHKVIDSSQQELQGVETYRAALKVVKFMQQHRGLSGGIIGGNESMKPKREEVAKQVAEAISTTEGRLNATQRADEAWGRVKKDWDSIKADGLTWTGPENFSQHTMMIGDLLRFAVTIADDAQMTLDPEIDSYYLIDTMVHKLAPALEKMGQLRAFGTNALSRKQVTEQRRNEINTLLTEIAATLRDLKVNVDKTLRYNPELVNTLGKGSDDLKTTAENVSFLTISDVIGSVFETPPGEFFKRTTEMIDGGYQLMDDIMAPTLVKLIERRIDKAWSDLYLNLGIVLAALIIVFYFSIGTYLATVASIKSLADSAHVIASGDLRQRIRLETRDELRLVGDSFNEMADAFSNLIRSVRTSADHVLSAARRTTESSAQITLSTEQQSEAASGMAAAVEEMTVGVDHIAKNAQDANALSTRAGELSTQGAQVVGSVVEEIRLIADRVNQSAAIITELGEQSNQISAIVNVIKEIADQTNLLALNAAIEAARAGESGRGFAVVADEVRKLAERTAKSTQEISTMINAIQSGTQRAVGSMQQGVERVGEGVEMARSAGSSMQEIEAGTRQVVEMVGDISTSLREQSAASTDIARNVERIAQMAEENSAAVAENAATARELQGLSEGLNAEISRFRLS